MNHLSYVFIYLYVESLIFVNCDGIPCCVLQCSTSNQEATVWQKLPRLTMTSVTSVIKSKPLTRDQLQSPSIAPWISILPAPSQAIALVAKN